MVLLIRSGKACRVVFCTINTTYTFVSLFRDFFVYKFFHNQIYKGMGSGGSFLKTKLKVINSIFFYNVTSVMKIEL